MSPFRVKEKTRGKEREPERAHARKSVKVRRIEKVSRRDRKMRKDVRVATVNQMNCAGLTGDQ